MLERNKINWSIIRKSIVRKNNKLKWIPFCTYREQKFIEEPTQGVSL